MVKLARYLKPYIPAILLAILLLFGQAMAELALPDYMSKIVNVGIQQGGIESAAPKIISANGMRLMAAFMNETDQALVQSQYALTGASIGDQALYEKYVKQYPGLESTDCYIQKKDADQKALGAAFSKAEWGFYTVMQDSAGASGAGQSQATDVNAAELDFSKIYAMIPQLEALPEEVKQHATDAADKMDASMRDQTGILFVNAFYTELGADMGGIQTAYMLKVGLVMLLIALGSAAAAVSVGFLASRLSSGLARDLRRDVFQKVESFSGREFDQFSTASLITRTTNDITQVQMLVVMGLRVVCYAPIMGIGGVLRAVSKSASMSWIIALVVLVLLGVIFLVFCIAMPKFKLVQKLIDKLNLVSRENLSGMMVIRAFGTQKFEEERFDKTNQELTRTNLFVNRVMVLMMPAMMLIMNGMTLLIVWVGSHQIAQATMQVGDMMAFMQYAMQIIFSFVMISMMFIMVPRASVSAVRISEVLHTAPSIHDPERPKDLSGCKGEVRFNHVSFRFSGAQDDVLHDISFTAKPGQTTAFIGSTGSGKSTLINLIPRFYDVTEGSITIDGIDIRDVKQHDLREQIGYIPQKGTLFSGTIASNLRYGDEDADDEALKEAAKIAQSLDFIAEKPDGFDSDISQGGSNVSGGQKQRLSIARALVKKPKIYIFDDSFSALDFKTDAALRHALKEYTGDSTVLIVAQRISTIRGAEQIIVLDEGHVVGIGAHDQLMQSCETYRDIASSQLTKEELQ